MKTIILGLLLSFSVFAGTDCYTDSLGSIHCIGDIDTDCYMDSFGTMHCN